MRKLLLLAVLFITVSCSDNYVDSIYFNGSIITMNNLQDTAEAISVKDGKIYAVGTLQEVEKNKGKHTKMLDLNGKTLLPGFIDSHGHTFGVGMQSVAANLYPYPDGNISNINDIVLTMKKYYDTKPQLYKELKWLIGFGYDESNLEEKRHPTKMDLDAVFPDIPVYLIHQSGHIGVANSKALEIINITSNTPNPTGGVIQRVGNTMEPNGVLEESIHMKVFFEVGQFSPIYASKMLLSGIDVMMSNGYTTTQEGRASSGQMIIMKALSVLRKLPIDLIAYPDVEKAKKWIKKTSSNYKGNYRVGGVKLTIDGSPQGKTAWRDRAYVVPPHGHPEDYKGYPAIDPEFAIQTIKESFSNNTPITVHANGEAAIDLFLEGVEKARAEYPDNNMKPILIHGQFMRKDHVNDIKRLDVFPSVFPMHTYYWGDWHREQTIGEPGVRHISPTKWLEDTGIMFTIHQDAPVVPPSSMRLLWTAVNRISRSGATIGAEQRISVLTALKSMTIWAANQLSEESSKGSLEVGKRADLVILSENPLESQSLTDIQILETIKDGNTVYKK